MPIEPLHALENGIFPACLDILFNQELTGVRGVYPKPELDRLCEAIFDLPRQRLISGGQEKAMPRMLWKEGVTGLAKVTANHKVGMMLIILMISFSKDGRNIFLMAMSPEKLRKMQEAFQGNVLCSQKRFELDIILFPGIWL